MVDILKKKLNWIDFTLVFLLILGILVFLNRGKILNKSKNVVSGGAKEVRITLVADELTREMVTDLKIGDQMFSQSSLQNGFVQEIEIKGKTKVEVNDQGKFVSYEDENEIEITVVIDGKVASSGPYMDLGGQEIKVGLPIIMKTTKVEFPATIKNIEVK